MAKVSDDQRLPTRRTTTAGGASANLPALPTIPGDAPYHPPTPVYRAPPSLPDSSPGAMPDLGDNPWYGGALTPTGTVAQPNALTPEDLAPLASMPSASPGAKAASPGSVGQSDPNDPDALPDPTPVPIYSYPTPTPSPRASSAAPATVALPPLVTWGGLALLAKFLLFS